MGEGGAFAGAQTVLRDGFGFEERLQFFARASVASPYSSVVVHRVAGCSIDKRIGAGEGYTGIEATQKNDCTVFEMHLIVLGCCAARIKFGACEAAFSARRSCPRDILYKDGCFRCTSRPCLQWSVVA